MKKLGADYMEWEAGGRGEEKEELFVPFGPDHLSPQLPSQNMPYNFA
jgi:hypothetical protein